MTLLLLLRSPAHFRQLRWHASCIVSPIEHGWRRRVISRGARVSVQDGANALSIFVDLNPVPLCVPLLAWPCVKATYSKTLISKKSDSFVVRSEVGSLARRSCLAAVTRRSSCGTRWASASTPSVSRTATLSGSAACGSPPSPPTPSLCPPAGTSSSRHTLLPLPVCPSPLIPPVCVPSPLTRHFLVSMQIHCRNLNSSSFFLSCFNLSENAMSAQEAPTVCCGVAILLCAGIPHHHHVPHLYLCQRVSLL